MLKTAFPFSRALRAGLAAAAIVTALAACGSSKWGFPYRPDVQQGNWITSEQVARLQPGMSRDQVRFVLGTPTLQDVFHAERWDYPYLHTPGYGKPQQRNFTVWFEGDQLARWEGDEQPDRQPFQRSDTGAPDKNAPAAPAADGTSTAQTAPVAPTGPATSEILRNDPTAQTTGTVEGQAARRPNILNNPERTPHTPAGAPSAGRSTSEPLR